MDEENKPIPIIASAIDDEDDDEDGDIADLLLCPKREGGRC